MVQLRPRKRLGCAETKVATWDDFAFKLIILGLEVKPSMLPKYLISIVLSLEQVKVGDDEVIILGAFSGSKCILFIDPKSTDNAKIARKRSKLDKHGHGKGKRIQKLAECYQRPRKFILPLLMDCGKLDDKLTMEELMGPYQLILG
ncbi:hypothetical protein Tco_0311490 [Tanacetum coccineum]